MKERHGSENISTDILQDIAPYAEILERMWERAGIENDYLFAVVMQDPNIFLPLVQRILPDLHLTHVTRHESQHSEYAAPDAKSVRYDVYSEIDGRQFVVEMQMRNTHNLERRARYYQSMLDIQNLEPGDDYRRLPDSFVIMICPFDPFGRRRRVYRFRNIDINDRDLELGDGADKIFIFTKGTADEVNPQLQNVLDLINGKAPADKYCQAVADCVDNAKNSVKVKRMYLNVNLKQMEERYEAEQQGHAKGLAEGIAQGQQREQENGLRILCNLVTSGKLSAADAAASAASYGVTSEDDLRERAQALGIQL